MISGLAVGSAAQPVAPPTATPLAVLTEDEVPGLSQAKVTEMLKRARVEYRTEVLPWARAYRRALTEPNTCLYSTTRTPQREPLFQWVAPLRSTQWVLVGRKGDPLTRDIRTLQGARGMTIGAYRDDAVAQFLESQGWRVDLVDTNRQNLRKLLAGRVDLWATSAAILPSLITDPELTDRVQVLATVREVRMFLACSPQTSAEIADRLRAASAQIETDGTAAQLERRFPP